MSKKQDKQEAIDTLLNQFELWPGDTLFTTCKHVSRSGMYRRISVFAMVNGEPRNISWHVAQVLGDRYRQDDQTVGVSGCGMDMGFHLVYSLSRVLFGETARTGKGKEANQLRRSLLKADMGYYTQGGSKPPNPNKPGNEWDTGYALKQRWM